MTPHYKNVGEIQITNRLRVGEGATAFEAAINLLEGSFQGLPVFSGAGDLVGKLTEMNLLKTLRAGKDLKSIRVGEIMSQAPPRLHSDTSLEEAVDIMDSNNLIRLPVFRSGRFIGSVTRHDLLRAWLGVWVNYERGNYSEVIG